MFNRDMEGDPRIMGSAVDVGADEGIGFDRVAAALAAYQRSQMFVDSPWARYVSGSEDTLGDDAKRGALRFLQPRAEGGSGYGCG